MDMRDNVGDICLNRDFCQQKQQENDDENWKFLEYFITQIVSTKCEQLCPNKQTNGGENCNNLLLGYAKQNEQILFSLNDKHDNHNNNDNNHNNGNIDLDEEEEEDVLCPVDTETGIDGEPEITDNRNMDEIFEMDERIASALDLLPDFFSIPTGEDIDNTSNISNYSNTQSIDQCLQILKNVDAGSINNHDRNYEMMSKIFEMQEIIQRLAIKMGTDEGYAPSKSDYEYSVDPQFCDDHDDEEEDDDDSYVFDNNNKSVTLMGDVTLY